MSRSSPPPYEELAPAALVVNLQVWHYRSEGRSPEHNERLANLFRNNVQEWDVIPFEDAGVTGTSSHDQFVPVEVRFRHRTWAYNDPGENPMADVRRLFFKIAPQFIYQYFIQILSTPHTLNIFPVGVPREFRPRYTHGYNLNPLGIRVNTFFVPGPANTGDVQSWLRDAVNGTADALRILAALISLFLMYQEQRSENGRPRIQRTARNPDVLDVEVPQRLRALFDEFRLPNRDLDARPVLQIANVQMALDRAAGPLKEYSRLAKTMDSRLKRLESGQTLSNQDLYELVQDAHSAALHFSTLKQAVRPLIKLLEEDYNIVIEQYKSDRNKLAATGGVTVGVLAAGAVFWWHPVGWVALSACAAGGAAGGAATAVGSHRMWCAEEGKAFDKKVGVRDFDIAMKAVDNCSNQAREAIAMVFCAQVMRKKLDETLPEHDRRAILSTFGVDVNATSSDIYNEELIKDRLRTFRENNNTMSKNVRRVIKDVNFELETSQHAA